MAGLMRLLQGMFLKSYEMKVTSLALLLRALGSASAGLSFDHVRGIHAHRWPSDRDFVWCLLSRPGRTFTVQICVESHASV